MSSLKENTEEKSMIKINENSIFYKIKTFFRDLFNKNRINENNVAKEEIISTTQIDNESSFMTDLKIIENEETKILRLQKAYRNGDIEEKDMTEEEISSLINLYDKQIADLKKSNEIRKQKLLKYRKNIQ